MELTRRSQLRVGVQSFCIYWDLFVLINIPPVREAFFRDFASQGRKTTLCRVSRVAKQLSRMKGSIHAWLFLALIQVLIYLF